MLSHQHNNTTRFSHKTPPLPQFNYPCWQNKNTEKHESAAQTIPDIKRHEGAAASLIPAQESKMDPVPDTSFSEYKSAGKLKGKVALITGGDSGIGRAVAIAFCMEGANVAILYNENNGDAKDTQKMCEDRGGKCLLLKKDVRKQDACKEAVAETVKEYGSLNISG